MATTKKEVPSCEMACTKTIKFMSEHTIPANTGISIPPYISVDGYRYINIFVQFNQIAANEAPVDLGVIFAFDRNGTLGSRRYVNFESNIPASQPVNFINVNGSGSWHGSPHNISTYLARFPIMGPYVLVFPFNRHTKPRKITIVGYLTT